VVAVRFLVPPTAPRAAARGATRSPAGSRCRLALLIAAVVALSPIHLARRGGSSPRRGRSPREPAAWRAARHAPDVALAPRAGAHCRGGARAA
jgi:hypothetical protein